MVRWTWCAWASVLPVVVVFGDRVEVVMYGESMCPDTRNFVNEVLPNLLDNAELMAVTDFDFVMWGNSYWRIPECGKQNGDPYDAAERKCWNDQCWHNVSAVCFPRGAERVYQHGAVEGKLDMYENCARMLLGHERALQLMRCIEKYVTDATPNPKGLFYDCMGRINYYHRFHEMIRCAGDYPLDVSSVDTMELANALATPPHDSVPYITVNGKGIPFEYNADLVSAVCAAANIPNISVCKKPTEVWA